MLIQDIVRLFYCGADTQNKNRIKYFNIQDDGHCGRRFEVNIDYYDNQGNKKWFQSIEQSIEKALEEFEIEFKENTDNQVPESYE